MKAGKRTFIMFLCIIATFTAIAVCGLGDEFKGIQDMREVLLFEKIAATSYSYSISSKTSRIIFYLVFKNSGILSVDFFTLIFWLLPNHVSFHSFNFLSTVSCDISA